MWRHRYSNQWIWHVQWTGTPERLNIRRGSALTKWSQKKKPTPPPPHLFSLAQRRWKDALVGLLHILPRLGKSGGHIPHSSPFSYSLRLSPPPPPLFFLHLRVETAVFCWRWRGRMGPSQGNFWRSGLSGRPGRANASWSCGEHQWLSMLSGIQDPASSVRSEMCALPRDVDLGNYLLAWNACLFCAVISVQVLMVLKKLPGGSALK